jgi:hypothetical protein
VQSRASPRQRGQANSPRASTRAATHAQGRAAGTSITDPTLSDQTEISPEESAPSPSRDLDTLPPAPAPGNDHQPPDSGAAQRLRNWETFTREHDDLLTKRIRADEHRRRARQNRRTFFDSLRAWTVSISQSPRTESDHGISLPEALKEALSDLETLDLDVEDMEDELVQAESAVSLTIPKILGAERNKTFEALEQEGLFCKTLESYSESAESVEYPSDPEPDPQRTAVLEKNEEINDLAEELGQLRMSRQLLIAQDEVDLTAERLLLLSTYNEQEQQLEETLRIVGDELQELRSLPASSSMSDDASEQALARRRAIVLQPPNLRENDIRRWLFQSG